MTKTVAYLVNQYPKVSHSFIRREIKALEALGCAVKRIAMRSEENLVDPEDQIEKHKTEYLLAGGIAQLLLSAATVALQYPSKFCTALLQAIKMSYKGDRTVLHHIAYLFEACRLTRILHKDGIQHVHVHFGTNSAEVALLAYILGGVPYSFTVHGPEEFDRPGALQLRKKIEASAFTVAVSSFGRSQLYRWVKNSFWWKIHVVHCGLESSFFNNPVTPVPDVPTLVCVGRLCEQKGQLILVEAAALLKAKGITFNLVLAGDGEMRPEIESLVKLRQLETFVRITGWIPNASVCVELVNARALVLPSFAEGLPVAIMEAMALNRPVITTSIAGIPELVVNELCGWVCTAGSIEELAAAIESCLTLPVDQLNQMAAAGRERVRARHSIEKEASKLLSLIEDAKPEGR